MISVIVPFDRDRGFLNQCKSSVFEQTYRHFELILAEGDKSVSANFNDGLEIATGEFCKFVTEDDWLPLNSLQDLSDGIGDHPWICANAEQHENRQKWIEKPQSLTFKDNVERNRIHGGTTLYRTELLREIGGMDESLWTGEEYDMHLKLMSLGYLPGYIDKTVYCHRLWTGQKSRQLRKNRKDERAKEIERIQSLYSDKV